MLPWMGLFQIISVATVVLGGGSTYITLKLRSNEYDPLVILVSENNWVYPLSPIKITTHKTGKDGVNFRVPKNHELVLACPAESPNELLMSKSQDQPLLFEKEFKKNLSCKTPLTPFFRALSTDGGNNCGKDGEGIFYVIGYRVRLMSKSSMNSDDYGQMIERYINLYEVCYSEKKGTMFTIHPMVKPDGYEFNKTPQTEFEKLNLNKIFKDKDVNELYKNKNSDESIYQFVPYDDMALMTWKNVTLFDINTILVKKEIKDHMDEINDVFKKSMAKITEPLIIYSGVTSSTDWKCYWKASRRYTPGEKTEIAILLCDTNSESVKPPCKYGKLTCSESGLMKLAETIPNLFCCHINESFAKKFGLVIKKNFKVVWGVESGNSDQDALPGRKDDTDSESSDESRDVLPAAPLTSVFVNKANADRSSDSNDDCGGTGLKCILAGFGGAGRGRKKSSSGGGHGGGGRGGGFWSWVGVGGLMDGGGGGGYGGGGGGFGGGGD